MTLDRKTFLRSTAFGGAAWLASTAARANAASTPALPAYDAAQPESFWRAVRAQFPLERELTYFNTGGLGPAPQPVLDVAAETTRRLQQRCEHGHAWFAQARSAAAQFFGASVAEIAFVRNATEATSIVAAGLDLKPGDEVVFESHAHPGGSFPWLNQRALRGIVVKVFTPSPDSPEENVRRIAALLTPRTRVVQVSHVTAPTGIVLPITAISAVCRERRIWFHVDGAQSAGMFPFSLRELGCDSFAASGHKWLGAPHETGVLFVRHDRLDAVRPVMIGAHSADTEAMPGELRLTETAERFEYGTRNVAAALAFAEATRFQERVGRVHIAERGRALAARVRTVLAPIRGIEILTPTAPELSASIVTFRAVRVPFDRLFERLMREHSMRCRPVSEQGLNALRVSTHLFNSPAECDALGLAMEKILATA